MELRLSEELHNKAYTVLDNVFITDFMPYMSELAVKCYLYGIYLIGRSAQNKEEQLKVILGCDNDDLLSLYDEMQGLGLITIRSSQPLNVEYLPINRDNIKLKKFNKDKYADFIITIQDLFQGRVLLPNELIKYVEVLEEYHIAPEAMIMIVAHCIAIKGGKININYILTVAKAWASEGVTTPESVEVHLRTIEANSESVRLIFCELGIKSIPDFEAKQLYIKWTSSWGYDLECIILAAKQLKKGSMTKLDTYLDKLYRSGIFTKQDISEYASYNKRATTLAIAVNTKLGLYYQDMSNIVATYITDWLNLGFEDNAILAIAAYCFKRSIRTLEHMNSIMNKFYSDGLVTLSDINQHIDNSISNDKIIRDLLETAGTPRSVKEVDRKYYLTWSVTWGLSHDIISYAASLSVGKMQSTTYMNVLLAKWHSEGLSTLAQCKESSPPPAQFTTTTKGDKTKSHSARFDGEREYTKEELDSVWGSMSNMDDLLK